MNSSSVAHKTIKEGAASYAKPEGADTSELEHQKKSIPASFHKKGTTLEKIAGNPFHQLNKYWPGAKEAFPFKPYHQTVMFFFPYANGGPLYVDVVKSAQQEKFAEEKRPVMKKLGLRYLVVKPDMSEAEMLSQLEQLPKEKSKK